MENVLIHYGTKNMKWHQRNYQFEDGTWTEEGLRRRRNGIAAGSKPTREEKKKQKTREKNLKKARAAKAKKAEEQKKKEELEKKTRAKNLKKARAARAKKAEEKKKQEELEKKEANRKKEFEENKEKILMSGSASDVLKYKGLLTNQELQTAVNRLNYEKQLSDIKASEVKDGWDKMDKTMKRVGQMTDWLKKGSEAYNTMAKVSNAIGGTDLPIIGEKREKKEDRSAIKKIIRSGNIDAIIKASGSMTLDELSEAAKRYENLNKLNNAVTRATEVEVNTIKARSSGNKKK